MSKKGLHLIPSNTKTSKELTLMMTFISYCDGLNSLLQIEDSLDVPICNLYDLERLLIYLKNKQKLSINVLNTNANT